MSTKEQDVHPPATNPALDTEEKEHVVEETPELKEDQVTRQEAGKDDDGILKESPNDDTAVVNDTMLVEVNWKTIPKFRWSQRMMKQKENLLPRWM
jgi:hypothetical protein